MKASELEALVRNLQEQVKTLREQTRTLQDIEEIKKYRELTVIIWKTG